MSQHDPELAEMIWLRLRTETWDWNSVVDGFHD